MSNDLWDNYECEGQMTLDDIFDMELPERMFAVSKIFARAKKQMNLPELKTLVYALANINYTKDNGNRIMLDKKTLAQIIGVQSDINHLSQDIKRQIGEIPKHSHIEISDKDRDYYESGVLITNIKMYRNNACIIFNQEFMPLFSNLEKDYITMWSSDIFNMSSDRSIKFYEDLRLNSDTRVTNRRGYGVKALKELFEIPKDGKGSYMREDGHFDRLAFEKRVINPICEDMAKCKMIQLIRQEDGKLFRKVKKGNRVLGYEFEWVVSDRPGIADAMKQKPKKKSKANSFNDYSQRHYTSEQFETLENKLLGVEN